MELQSVNLEERFEKLLIYGKQVEATSNSIDINRQPDFFNEIKFLKAQQTCQKYYTNLSMASSTGLILLMQLDSILIPLLKTGKSRTVSDLYDRYTATAIYIRKCYETNFYHSSSEGWRYINLVRAMHKRIHTSMKENDESEVIQSEHPNVVWVNQYDMVITQFAFVGLFLLNPEKCGAYHVTKEEMADVTYLWHLLGYYFGIEERFNLFAFESKQMEKQTDYLNMILSHLKELLNGKRNRIGLQMAEGFTLSFADFSPSSTLNILDHWWSPFISLSGCGQLKVYSWSERWKVLHFLFYFKLVFRSETLLSLMNWFYKIKFDKFCASGDTVRRKLNQKHGSIRFE